MTIKDSSGVAKSKATVLGLMTDVTPDENKVYRFDNPAMDEFFQHETLPGHTTIDGDKQLAFSPNGLYTLSEINGFFPEAVVTSITKKVGGTGISDLPAAGGTVLVIRGDNLTGVTAVTFGGTAGTSVTVVDRYTVEVTTPAKAAGTYTIAITDDSGSVNDDDFPLTNAATYV